MGILPPNLALLSLATFLPPPGGLPVYPWVTLLWDSQLHLIKPARLPGLSLARASPNQPGSSVLH